MLISTTGCQSVIPYQPYTSVIDDAYQSMLQQPGKFAVPFREMHRQIVSRIREICCTALSHAQQDECSVVITGSEARQEKLYNTSHGGVEVIIIRRRSGEDNESIVLEMLTHAFTQDCTTSDLLRGFTIGVKAIESHTADTDILTCCGLEIPVRAMETCFIAGNPVIFEEYQAAFIVQITEMHPRRLKSFVDIFLKDSIKQIGKLLAKTSPHCDVDTGTIYFNNRRIKGTKYTLLRPVQYIVDYIIIRKIRDGVFNAKDLNEMPLPIIPRLTWLHSKGGLPWMDGGDVISLQGAYQAALLWHQMTQAMRDDEIRAGRLNESDKFATSFCGSHNLTRVSCIINAFASDYMYSVQAPVEDVAKGSPSPRPCSSADSRKSPAAKNRLRTISLEMALSSSPALLVIESNPDSSCAVSASRGRSTVEPVRLAVHFSDFLPLVSVEGCEGVLSPLSIFSPGVDPCASSFRVDSVLSTIESVSPPTLSDITRAIPARKQA